MPSKVTDVLLGLVCGIALSVIVAMLTIASIVTVEVPFRYGDRVLVKNGFMARRIGKIIDRHSDEKKDKNPKFDIAFEVDEGKKSHGTFRADELVLIGGWDTNP